ncbi:MAG: hypothetical protein ACPGWR_25450, partial [Ardenticatenaceae bacterium]
NEFLEAKVPLWEQIPEEPRFFAALRMTTDGLFRQPEKVTHLSSEVGYLSSAVGHLENDPPSSFKGRFFPTSLGKCPARFA